MSLVYLASPYTSYVYGKFWAYDHACRAAARIALADIPVYSPIVQGHVISQRMPEMPHDFWMRHCEPVMAAADRCVILMIDGWLTSKGVLAEWRFFTERKVPLCFMTPQHLDNASDDELREILVPTQQGYSL